MKITATLLKSKGACADQVALFRKLFPKGGAVTETKCLAVASLFNWEWAAQNLLPASALAEYWKVEASALAEYWKVTASAWAEYRKVTASAWAEYRKVEAPAWAEYRKVTASAFGRIAEKLP